MLPTNAVISINFTDMYYSPQVVTALGDYPLNMHLPYGYIWWNYRRSDVTHDLDDKLRAGIAPVWSNNYYFLYQRR